MKLLLSLVAGAMALAGSSCHSDDPPGAGASSIPSSVVCEWATIRFVTDGDTVRADFEDGRENQPVRYIGIDTPEVDPRNAVEPFGPEASERNADLVLDERVCLERDVSDVDRFGRLLRYAWLPDGTLVNERLVLEGLATTLTIPPDVKYAERLLAAQSDARKAKARLWAE